MTGRGGDRIDAHSRPDVGDGAGDVAVAGGGDDERETTDAVPVEPFEQPPGIGRTVEHEHGVAPEVRAAGELDGGVGRRRRTSERQEHRDERH
ncbi:MAG TPA: hypothetical protein VEA78_08005, partial [Acidimicrobiales bacterium]|nr:hypothetical protein [Acidimicrobiales bacterium]